MVVKDEKKTAELDNGANAGPSEEFLAAGIGDALSVAKVQEAPRSVAPSGAGNTPLHGYERLQEILKLAFAQSATGKGRERHAYGPMGFKPWTEQPIMEIGRMVGPGGHAYQVNKKAQEAINMATRGDFNAAKAEVLGAIVYAAAMYHILDEQQAVFSQTTK